MIACSNDPSLIRPCTAWYAFLACRSTKSRASRAFVRAVGPAASVTGRNAQWPAAHRARSGP